MGLQLNTAVGYSLVDQTFDDDGTLTEVDSYYGNGGTNRVFLGYGYKFPFNVSFGIELAYIFGGIDNNVTNQKKQCSIGHKSNYRL